MKPQKTKEIFKEYETETITDEVIEEIENNLKSYFTTLVEWSQKEEEEKNDSRYN